MVLAITSSGKVWLAVVGGIFIVFAAVVALVVPRSRPDFPGKHLRPFLAVVVALFVAMIATVWMTASGEEGGEAVATETQPATTEAGGGGAAGDAAAGKEVFATAGCGGCHTLGAAGSSGAVGPNLDGAKPSAERVVDRVTNGKGVMPPFKGSLTEQQIADVAAFVSESAGT
ncbi:MAG: cytochrome c [Actinobacteria bacterium]|nr:cytochrome c [Actinomycetota bacterium]